MEIEEAIRTYLLTKTAIKNLVDTRITPDDIGAVLPAISYLKVSDVKDHTLTGQSELERPVFQFSTYAESKSTARSITNAIKSALCDFSGYLSGIEIQHIKLLNEMSSKYQTDAGNFFVEDLEFQINFIRS